MFRFLSNPGKAYGQFPFFGKWYHHLLDSIYSSRSLTSVAHLYPVQCILPFVYSPYSTLCVSFMSAFLPSPQQHYFTLGFVSFLLDYCNIVLKHILRFSPK